MAKATNAEREARLNRIYSLLIAGATRYEILQYTADTWNLKSRATDAYIADANAMIAQEGEYYRFKPLNSNWEQQTEFVHVEKVETFLIT